MLEVSCLPPRWPGHQAGQFALLRLDAKEGSHPFTIASAWPGHGELRFVIKALGDYTASLAGRLQVGMAVEVEGPYGGFTGAVDGRRWMARKCGWPGVGVTPFLAWLQAAWRPLTVPVDFSTVCAMPVKLPRWKKYARHVVGWVSVCMCWRVTRSTAAG
jgi:predicted ferric reductase